MFGDSKWLALNQWWFTFGRWNCSWLAFGFVASILLIRISKIFWPMARSRNYLKAMKMMDPPSFRRRYIGPVLASRCIDFVDELGTENDRWPRGHDCCLSTISLFLHLSTCFVDDPCFFVLCKLWKTTPTIASPGNKLLLFDISELISFFSPAEVGSTSKEEDIDYNDDWMVDLRTKSPDSR